MVNIRAQQEADENDLEIQRSIEAEIKKGLQLETEQREMDERMARRAESGFFDYDELYLEPEEREGEEAA